MKDLTEARDTTRHAARHLHTALRGLAVRHAREAGADAVRALGDTIVSWAYDLRTALYAEAQMMERDAGMADSRYATVKDEPHG
jgi:hypothetical protein